MRATELGDLDKSEISHIIHMLRSVTLPDGVPGRLYLASMPGRYEPYEKAKEQIVGDRITRVVCLVPHEEVREKSPRYAHAIEAGNVPWAHEHFGIPDYEAPADRDAFWDLAQVIARFLVQGERILVHCAGGIGRTGTFAICVLMAMGLTQGQSRRAVGKVGSSPESQSQDDVISWVAQDRLASSG